MATNTVHRFPVTFRDAIAAALPEDVAHHGETPAVKYTYLPATHLKALRPEAMLVSGIRGSGKSFWWAALQDPQCRETLGVKFGIRRETLVSGGFGVKPDPDAYPGKDVIGALMRTFDPRLIWKTVVFRAVCADSAPEAFRTCKEWRNRVHWLTENPESVERALVARDAALGRQGIEHMVLFDAMDRTADDWASMHALMRGILQAALEFRSYNRIRLKVFVRPDQIADPATAAFPDASKVLSQKVELQWSRSELYGLLWQYLANADAAGAVFRQTCAMIVSAPWSQSNGVWAVPDALRNDEAAQRDVFHAMTGPWMGRDRRRGFPYTWLHSHLCDVRRQVSPRSFLAALRHAACDAPRAEQEYALHYESIKRGVQQASTIRVNEVEEDYPWVQRLLAPLRGITVPCELGRVEQLWNEKHVLTHLQDQINTASVRLPPANIAQGSAGVLQDLESLGLLEPLSDGRVNMPDVYRVGYGIGRRGGVMPVES